MTGLSAEGSYLYLGSRAQNWAYRYTLPSITGRTTYTYFNGFSNTRDIAKTPGMNNVWVATDNSGMTLGCFNSYYVRIDEITSDLVPYARGVAMDPAGYLWVSDPVNDLIYKIELSVALERSTWGEIKASF